MCLVLNTGTVTRELSCNCTIPLIGQRQLVFIDFCADINSDFLDLSLADRSKFGESR